MKVQVIIDMPNKCEECKFSYYTEGCFSSCCNLNGRNFAKIENPYGCDDYEGYMEERPKWCPLNECEKIN